ncbi:MAG: hypothetical protein IBJ03_05135 [Gemmatimonadaceae bacterium]|nr:hypothetical protein [Gemmatimonadaceae bacterium]
MMPFTFDLIPARARLATLAVCAVFITACTSGDRAPADTTATATMSSDTGAWQDGDEQIAWSSDIVDGNITEITEQVTFGTDGRAERVLRFTPSGSLTEFRETRTQTVQNSAQSPSTMRVELQVTFAGDTVVSQSKTVDGAPSTVQPYDLDNIRRHAAATLQQLRLPDSSAAARRD